MMLMVSLTNCPRCGMKGKKCKGEKTMVCPSCSTVFSEFGIMSDGMKKEDHNLS